MQINTRNPDGSGQRCGAACPLPRRQNAWEGARWSGLLECPCGTRMVKTFDHRRVRDPTPGCTYRSAGFAQWASVGIPYGSTDQRRKKPRKAQIYPSKGGP